MNEWQLIDAAPKDGTRLLLWVPGEEHIIGYYTKEKGTYAFEGWTSGFESSGGYDIGYISLGEPTFWIPLPKPPIE